MRRSLQKGKRGKYNFISFFSSEHVKDQIANLFIAKKAFLLLFQKGAAECVFVSQRKGNAEEEECNV